MSIFVDKEKINKFIEELAKNAKSPGKVYLCGGATVLLLGLREQTIDIDLKLDPEPRGVFEAFNTLKKSLQINVELASPDNFIPTTKDWKENSLFIKSINSVDFYHYDLTVQSLAKIERGHQRDLDDVCSLIKAGFVSVENLKETFSNIKPKIVRYPSLSIEEFEKKVIEFIGKLNKL